MKRPRESKAAVPKEKNLLFIIALHPRSQHWYKLIKKLDEIKPKVKELRRVIKLCDGIEERIPRIEKNTQEFVDNERKESEKSEHIK